jgi:GntR family transcriptional regulator
VHGKGTFVAPARVESQLHLASFTDEMRRRGLEPTTKVLEMALGSPPRRAQVELGLDSTDRVWCLERLRVAAGEPMALERGWYPERLLHGLDRHDLSASLYTLFAGRTSSAGRTAVEHNLSWYRGDRYQVHMSLDRGLRPGQNRTQGGSTT